MRKVVLAALLLSACSRNNGPQVTVGSSDAGNPSASQKIPSKSGCDQDLQDRVVQGATLTLETKCSPYVVNGQLQVAGSATLEIQPGVEVRFEKGASLAAGGTGTAKVIAHGTADAPIRFTSNLTSKAPGDWAGLYFFQGAAGSELEHVIVEFGGSDPEKGEIRVEAPIRITASAIQDSAGYGLVGAEGGRADFSGNTVQKTAKAPLRIEAGALGGLGDGNRYQRDARIEVVGGKIEGSVEVRDQGIPYELREGNIDVAGEETEPSELVLDRGVTFLFADDVDGIEVGDSDAGGRLKAIGDENKPIMLKSASGTKGGFGGIVVYDHGKIDAEHLWIDGAGKDDNRGELTVSGGIARLVSCHFLHSRNLGVASNTPFVEFKDDHFEDNDKADLSIDTNVAGSLGEANVFDDASAIEVTGGTLTKSATWRAFKAPYVLLEKGLTMDGDDLDLTLQPGVKLEFAPDTTLSVGEHGKASIKALGTADKPIVLTGIREEKGAWGGVRIGSNAHDSAIDGAIVSWAGKEDDPRSAAIEIDGQAQVKLGAIRLEHVNNGVVTACKAPKVVLDPKKLKTDDVKNSYKKDCS